EGYRDESGVDSDSRVETYAALKLYLDTWRWEGVPFYVRSGKNMPRKLTEIVVKFKPTPHCLFRQGPLAEQSLPPNQIVINVQPEEGIRLRFGGKVPGSRMQIEPVIMDFDYVQQFNAQPPEAYATLLLDALRGDQTLFKHRDEIERSWRIVQPVLDTWAEDASSAMPTYAPHTWGPAEADALMDRTDRAWHNPESSPAVADVS
ncbi:MAG: hypothetical protein R3336_00420, partial [Phycisphaeraceae bacterium]|nr:hypothetical protein [Phycisphaeraceae bacterium]